MNVTILTAVITLAIVASTCTLLWKGQKSRRIRAFILFVFFATLTLVCVAIDQEFRLGVRTISESIRWEDLETGKVYYAPAYVKVGERVIAVVEKDRSLHLMEIPFTPHSAYLQPLVDKNGHQHLGQLTKTVTASMFDIDGPPPKRTATAHTK